MKRRLFGLGLLAALAVSGCSRGRVYSGPPVTSIVVNKSSKRMYLLSQAEILKAYDVDLGFAPAGPKQFEGDGRTPEGSYVIDRRNPDSLFHLSVGISYPNEADIAFAEAQGRSPGGDIFIHGQPNNDKKAGKKANWTAGCIAVKDEEIEDVYAMLRPGVPIVIYP